MPRSVRLVSIAAACLACAAVAGCTTYGSPTVLTKVDVLPDKAYVYVVPYDVWLEHGGQEMLDDRDLISRYRVGVSPVTDELKRDRHYVFVAERNDEFMWVDQKVNKSDRDVTIEFLE
jgi:hypothetical protein